jgi:hypothetical protein
MLTKASQLLWNTLKNRPKLRLLLKQKRPNFKQYNKEKSLRLNKSLNKRLNKKRNP